MSDLDELIAPMYAPWDARAWENLVEAHGEVAEQILDAVGRGATPEAVRRYGEQLGYSSRVIGWLVQATAHAQRRLLPDKDVEPEPAAVATPPARPRPPTSHTPISGL